MKTICILTATRAEYGLLSPIIHALKSCKKFKIKLVVTGAHLSNEFGLTYKEILADGVKIDKKIEILLGSDSNASISKSMGLALISFADYFGQNKPDALLVLGDRYETLAVCCAAMNEQIPIIHLYGGETTQGAIDEAIRHSITKISFLHLTSTEEYRKRVIQLGEDPKRVFNVGAIGVENALKKKLMTKKELECSINFLLDKPYAVVTFHPTTLQKNNSEKEVRELLKALNKNQNMKYIITKANADAGGRTINQIIDKYALAHTNVLASASLGSLCYLSALKYAEMTIGNSSSGISEVPSFGIPTVNIGDRQKGRIRAKSVIDCKPQSDSICKAIKQAQNTQFRKICALKINPYEKKGTSKRIVKAIVDMFNHPIDLKKKFYDIKFQF